jgi:hypothetical protein
MIPGVDDQAIVYILWGVAILVLAWTWVPAFISSMGGTRYLVGFSNDVTGLEPSPREPDYSYWAQQLLDLGYEPVGTGWIRVNFAGPTWAIWSPVRVFRKPSVGTFAYVSRAPAPYYFWPGAVFATCLADGRLLTSDNNRAADLDVEDEHIKQGMVTLDLAALEAQHQEALDALKRSGFRPEGDLNIETLMRALERHEGPEARRAHARAGTNYLFAHGLIHICVSIPTAYLLGIMHWSVPLSNLVLALALITGENSQKRVYAQAVRSAMRNQQRGIAGAKTP